MLKAMRLSVLVVAAVALVVRCGGEESSWPVENRILTLKNNNAGPRSDTPPSYMVHLYNRYRKGRMPYSAANTVRSFYPTPGRLGSDDLLVFNLTGVHPSEYVERVELHLQPGFGPQRKLQLDILDLSRPLRPRVETLPLTKTQSRQVVDITDSIIACLEGEAEQHHLVGVSMRGSSGNLSDQQPFVVLFSEDDDHLTIQELERDAVRAKRQILDNELPDYQVEGSSKEVQARLKYKSLDSPPEGVPRPEARRGDKHRKRRRRRKKEKRLPYSWGKTWWRKEDSKNNPDYEGDDNGDDDYEDTDEDLQICQRRRMVVDFAEIGWGDWVISPKSFDASYCAGSCEHPLKKSVLSSNHATIHSLVRSLGGRKSVPGLCCAPYSLSPLSLLYYDEHRNVVLKSFPNMSVDACSCR